MMWGIIIIKFIFSFILITNADVTPEVEDSEVRATGGVCPGPRHEFNGQRVKSSSSATVYLVLDGVRRAIPNENTYNNLFRDWTGITITDVESISLGSILTDGAILASSPSEAPVYLISNGIKRWIISLPVYNAYHFDSKKIVTLPKMVLEIIPKGENIGESPKTKNECPRHDLNGELVKSSDSTSVYLILDGLRRGIPNEKTYNLLFRDWKVIKIMNVNEIPLGPNLTDGALLVKNPVESAVYLVSNGVKRGITSEQSFEKYHFSWDKIVVVPKVVVDIIPLGNTIS